MPTIKQSSTAEALEFLMVDSSDHLAGKTGLSPTVTIRKANPSAAGSFITPSGTVRELANGWYQVDGNATDTDTLGTLILHATATGADPVDKEWKVSTLNPLTAIAQTGDNYARLGAPAGASVSADIAAAKVDTAAIKVKTDLLALNGSGYVTATNPGSGDSAATIWAYGTRVLTAGTNIVLPSGGLANVTAWTVNLTGNLSGSVGSVTTAITLPSIPANWITAAGIATDAIDADALASDAVTEISAGVLAATVDGIAVSKLLQVLLAEAVNIGDYNTGTNTWVVKARDGATTVFTIVYGADNGDRTSSVIA